MLNCYNKKNYSKCLNKIHACNWVVYYSSAKGIKGQKKEKYGSLIKLKHILFLRFITREYVNKNVNSRFKSI